MLSVSVTTFRKQLPEYLGKVTRGEGISLTSRGKVIALIVPAVDERKNAREKLLALRSKAFVGDVLSPIDEKWEADSADT